MRTFDEIKSGIESNKSDCPKHYEPSQGLRGSIAGVLNSSCKGDANRKLFLKAVFGVTSSALLQPADWWASKYFIDSRQFGTVWLPREEFEGECGVVLAQVVKQEGQMELL